MEQEYALEHAARLVAVMEGMAVTATRPVPRRDRARFRDAAQDVASRFGVRVTIEDDDDTAVARFYREDGGAT